MAKFSDLLTLDQARCHSLALSVNRGEPIPLMSLYRATVSGGGTWQGCRLETIRVGGRRLTTIQMLRRFVAAVRKNQVAGACYRHKKEAALAN